MEKKIIFFFSEQFTETYYNRFGIDLLQKNGFVVEVWDLSSAMYPSVQKKYVAPDLMDIPNCIRFKDAKEAIGRIKNLSEGTFVFFISGYTYYSYQFFKALSDSKASYGVWSTDAIAPLLNGKKDLFVYYLRKIPTITLEKLFNPKLLPAFVFNKFPNLWPKIKPARLHVAGGERSIYSYTYPLGETTEVLWTHNTDYDNYLGGKDVKCIEKNTAVFIDEYYPFHPDFFYSGVKPPVTAEQYYPKLNKLFDKVEKDLGLEVVIAAHPRSNYEKHPDFFAGRCCSRGRTATLIRESKLILAHSSTALSVANIYYKPAIFLTSKELDKSWVRTWIWNMADWFGKKPIFVETADEIDWKNEMNVNKEAYDKYCQAYIKTKGSEELPRSQIIANRLKRSDIWS
jgi:hypothetical protein